MRKDKYKNMFNVKRENMQAFFALSGKEKKNIIFNKLIDSALFILIAVFVIVVFCYNINFLKFDSIVNIVTQSASRLIMALGVAGIIVLTGTDLSAGRIMGLCACICASILQRNGLVEKMFPSLSYTPWLIVVALLISMLVGGLIGAFNGYFVAKFHLHPFIVTLGTQLILYGLTMGYVMLGNNEGRPIAGLAPSYVEVIKGGFKIGRVTIPNLIWIAIAVTIIMWFVWNKTRLGKNMFAVGCNPDAARVSGISVFKTILIVFVMAGVLYGITAFIESARIGSNSTQTGFNYELDAIAACVIGGVSFMGGIGKIKGVIMGVLLLQLLNSGLVFLQLDPFVQTIVKGVIILVASAIDMRKYVSRR